MMINEFINKLASEGKSKQTLKNYTSTLNTFCEWLSTTDPTTGGTTPSDGLRLATQLDIANFKKYATSRYQPDYVRMMLTQLRAFYRYLTSVNAIPDNPVEHVKGVTTAKKTPKWLDKQQQNTLIRFVRKYGDLRELTIITLLLHTGLRVEELCNLQLTDVILTDRKGKVIVRKGKWNRYREIPLNIDCRRILAKYIADRDGVTTINPTVNVDINDYLFTSQRSPQMSTRAVQHIIEKYRKLTGIDDLHAHSLRHSFLHELVVRKIPLDVVARLAGHMKANGLPNIEQTLVYTQPGEDDLQRAVEELSWI